MKKKITVLVIGKEDSDYHYLREKYNLMFREENYLVSPFEQMKEILASLEDIHIDGVIGLQDLASIIAALIAQERHLVGPPPYAIYLAQNKALFSQYMIGKHLCYPHTTII